jgi:hypothetical protein
VAIIDKEALLRYLVQGLHLNIWIGLAAALPDNLQVAQIVARAINLFVVEKKNNLQEQKPEPMDTTSGQSTGRCNWCNFPGHFERECRIKAKGLSKKDYTQGGQRKQSFNGKCNSCGKISHMARNCKVKNVREGETEENKNVDNYLLCKEEGK